MNSARAALLLSLCACNALLGIEDLKTRPDAGSDVIEQREQGVTSPPDAGDAGESKDNREPRDREATNAPTAAGSPAAGSDADMKAQAGAGGSTPLHAAGQTGALPAAMPVAGTVVDYRRRILPGTIVRIGDRETMTDADGKFTLDDVPSRYDVTVLIQTSISNSATTLVWQFQGLSRRDPTLQVYRGLPERFAEFRSHIDNVTFPLLPDQTILLGWSSPDGDFNTDTTSADLEFLSPVWTGPATSSGTAHALLVTTSSGAPTQYHAYNAQHVVMTADMQARADFDLGAPLTDSSTIRGEVTSSSSLGERRNEVYLRFQNQNTALKLFEHWSAGDTFDYVVPNLPDSSLTVVAKSVANPPGIAAAYAEVEPGGDPLALALPSLPLLTAPEDGKAQVDSDTEFHWSGSARVFMLVARSIQTYDAIYVVTEAKQTRLPIGLQFGYIPPTSSDFEWSIEVHGAHASIDEACSETGHLSAYGSETIRGPKRGAGTFARSTPRVFTTAP